MRYINAEYKVYICESNIFPGTGDLDNQKKQMMLLKIL